MSLYDLSKDKFPGIKFPRFRAKTDGLTPLEAPLLTGLTRVLLVFVFVAFVASFFGILGGILAGTYFSSNINSYLEKLKLTPEAGNPAAAKGYSPQTSQEQAVINAVKENSPAVVSIIISKDVPIIEQYYINPFEGLGAPFDIQIPQYRQKGVEKKQVGGGTGFIVSDDGMILTNKHVVSDKSAEYTVLTNDGQQFNAKVLARDPFQDLAVLKITRESAIDEQGTVSVKPFSVALLGDSDKLNIGQTVIAIGNALGEFRNTVSSGVISGLGRTINASGGGMSETIEDVIQTDAAINLGNSGGPLLNLKGEVIGVNVATEQSAQNISFAIPINYAKKDIEQVKSLGKISPPFLGIYYTLITDKLKDDNQLSVNYGAWVGRNDYGKPTDVAVAVGSAAEKAGLQRDDIILEFGNEKITADNPLKKIIAKYNPGDKVVLKILRGQEYKTMEITLGERTE